MRNLEFAMPEKLSLKNDPQFNEKWLEERIIENPKMLGLDEVEVIDRQRKQKNGILDLLLADFENNKRYEIEIMLGTTDESHIIRCIEYWDEEKRRYPQYEHCAVLVAEDITSRFLNVLSLFNGHIPMIVLQLSALKLDNKILLHFARVMDKFDLRRDDENEPILVETDRNYWNNRASNKSVEIADKLLEMVNQKTQNKLHLNFNKFYIGLSDGIKSRNFIHFKPKKLFTHILMEIDIKEEWVSKLEEKGISSSIKGKWLQITINHNQLTKDNELLSELINGVVDLFNKD